VTSEVEEMYGNLPDPDTCVVVIGAITHADVPALCERLRDLVEGRPVEVVVCEVGALAADLLAVEALARLQLTAQRCGCRIRLCEASRELETLLELCGLGETWASHGQAGGG
jgi:anti-anti-sigma regulatory factor